MDSQSLVALPYLWCCLSLSLPLAISSAFSHLSSPVSSFACSFKEASEFLSVNLHSFLSLIRSGLGLWFCCRPSDDACVFFQLKQILAPLFWQERQNGCCQ